jgi:UDP-glucuronate 4-epimerase
MPKVLITGAAGFIGMHTAIRFLREGWDVVGLDNINDYYSVSLKRDRIKEILVEASKLTCSFELFEADLNSEIWKRLELIKFDAIIHLAAQAGVRYSIENPRAYLESNILGFQSVLEFVTKTEQKRFLYASSSSVYGKNSAQPFSEEAACDSPESYYASTKRANELMAKAYFHTEGVASIGLRFFTVYGPWGRPDMAPMLFADAAYNNVPIKVFNHGNQSRDFTYIDDIVEGILSLVLMSEFPRSAEVCNLGNGSPVQLLEFIMQLEQATSKLISKKLVDAQKGDVAHTYADTAKIESLTGYSSKTNLNRGIRIFVDWYKGYYAK